MHLLQKTETFRIFLFFKYSFANLFLICYHSYIVTVVISADLLSKYLRRYQPVKTNIGWLPINYN